MANSTKKEIKYRFVYVEHCNMCGSPTAKHKILGKRLNSSQGKSPDKKIGITTTIVRCSDCGLIYSNPQPIPFDIQDHYGVPPEDYWKENYFVVKEDYMKRETELLKTLVGFKPGMKILDIGAGLGKAMIIFEKAGFEAYGFESSIPFHDRAISRMGIRPERLKLAPIETVEYAENEFDVVVFGAVLEHVYDPTDSIQRALKWVKPGGLIYIQVPSSDWLIGRFINWYYKLTGHAYVGNLSPMHEPYHLYEFTLKSFEENAKKLNYEIASHLYLVAGSYMPKVLDKVVRPYMKSTDQGMQLEVILRKK